MVVTSTIVQATTDHIIIGTGLEINTSTPGRRGSFSSRTYSQSQSYAAVTLLGVCLDDGYGMVLVGGMF